MKRLRNAAPPIPPGGGAQHTPYPEFQVTNTDKWDLDWDDKTRQLVLDRLENIPPYRFFSADEARLLEALCDCVLPQPDRPEAQRVPIAPWIDERLHNGAGPGYRYENMPDDRQAYRLGLQGFDETARYLFDMTFLKLPGVGRETVMRHVAEGSPPGKSWESLPAAIFFQMFVNEVITNYYAHPAAWAEIGFNGPASPRGHIRLRLNFRDPWEAEECRPRSSVEIVRRSRGKGHGPAKGGPTH